jgi:hypothetical protein
MLDEELGVEPMQETRALCADLLDAATRVTRASRPPSPASGAKPTARSTRSRVAPSLRAAAASLEDARKAIDDAIRLAESDPEDA